ncbi:MAG: hypothetical protein ACQETB_04970 [Halobacteriota archaeon]
MTATSRAGILISGAVAFVILWEFRSAVGLFFGTELNPVAYILVSLVVITSIAVGLEIGVIGRSTEPDDASTDGGRKS